MAKKKVARKKKQRWTFKYEMYQHLAATQAEFYEKVKKIPKEVGLPDKFLARSACRGRSPRTTASCARKSSRR